MQGAYTIHPITYYLLGDPGGIASPRESGLGNELGLFLLQTDKAEKESG